MKPNICLYGNCYVLKIQSYLGTTENFFETEKYVLHFSVIPSQYSFLHTHFREQISNLCKKYPFVLNFASIPKVHKDDKPCLDQGYWLPDRGEWTPEKSGDFYSKQQPSILPIIMSVEKCYYEQTRSFLDLFPNLTLCYLARFFCDKKKSYYQSSYSNHKTLFETFKLRCLDLDFLDSKLNLSTMLGGDPFHIRQIDGKPDASKLIAIIDYYYENYCSK